MVQSQEKYILKMTAKKNKYFNIIQTRKYKNIDLYLNFSLPYSFDNKAQMVLLSKLFFEASKQYPNKKEMTKAKDMLYGISCFSDFKATGNIISLSIHYSFINPKFLNDINYLDYVFFIKETLFNLLIRNKDITEAKRNLIANLQRRLEKPSAYASERIVNIICQDYDDFSVYDLSKKLISAIKKIQRKELIEFYNYLLEKGQLYVFLIGDLNKEAVNLLGDYNFADRIELSYKPLIHDYSEKDIIIEDKKLSQSYLSVIYATPFTRWHPDFYAWVLGNFFLGIAPTSLLFEQLREKLSLCYSISCSNYKLEGLVKIYTQIDADKYEMVVEEIKQQINHLINQDYDDNKLEMTKALLINNLMSIYDDNDALVDYQFQNYLSQVDISLEEYCKKLQDITKEDLSRVFKQYNHYFTYLLKGSTND